MCSHKNKYLPRLTHTEYNHPKKAKTTLSTRMLFFYILHRLRPLSILTTPRLGKLPSNAVESIAVNLN
jgi:hypothetical protein